ncbi:leucyl aminopeptidase [Candidatus Neptunochlamydia vexilliferae]|uniref:Probable cytosol aminopeptidase n=1 Tax=Candidatus Neptunichlamydia vexilliferae TaxID=1651774 RepID=A0ABS0B0R6_9BACT|nr:leucyl aminopeptidase [Candidatus Neptunochlamydia vexilliferae]MBF5059956.1 putative cytosol aminopeptidase [Candidatus Neptunochlamydia vexilliferae]
MDFATPSKRPKADLVVVPCFKTKKGAVLAATVSDLKGAVTPILKAGDFNGEEGATMLAYLTGKTEKRLLFLGLGEESCTMEGLRRAYAAAMKRCQNKKWPTVNFLLPKHPKLAVDDVTRAVSEGIALSSYVFDEWKSKEGKKPFFIKKANLIGAKNKTIPAKTLKILSGVNLARNLINRNALDITPQALGKEAEKIATAFPVVKATILNKKALEKEKMGLLLAVGNGSSMDPALIMLEYKGAPRSDDLTMVVGKGVTFDTGGLNLKPTNFIEDMRTDMGGGAAAIGLIQAAASLKLKVNIVAVVPATENAMDAHSYKPGDVYRAHSGKTVEITNTDAEGRLILADALSYGQKRFKPNRIIDMATLTGAAVVALGEERAALFSNNDTLAKLCEKAGETTGEKVWRMPLDPEYRSLMDSSIADIRNAGKKRAAGCITAAIFLQEFVEKKTPWIHLDIAGTGFIDAPEHYHLSQATGFGIRLLIEMIECLSSK